jgi:hypothetical protein
VKINLKQLAGIWICAVIIMVAGSAGGPTAAADPVQAMIGRVISQDKLSGDRALYFQKLTGLLFEYLRTSVKPEALEPLYTAGSTAELSRLLEKHLRQSVLDFGEKMFSFFEEKAAGDKSVDLKTWKAAETAHFAFFAHPGSQADKDLDLIKRSAEEAFAAIVSCLGMEREEEKSFMVLKTEAPQGLAGPTALSPAGRISVFLYSGLPPEAKQLKGSMGNMSFGATIVKDPAKDQGAGRLTAKVNVLYLNAYSLTVLHHEIGHAALFLGHFDPGPLTSRPLRGESDLKKAFFAGYKSIPPFLHEGIGDYVVYFQSFYKNWPLLPPPEAMVLSLAQTKDFVPLQTLLQEGVKFRAQHHKAYSLEAASVMDYLLRTHGRDKLKAWLQTADSDSRKAFQKVYGFSIQELEERWKTALKNKAGF